MFIVFVFVCLQQIHDSSLGSSDDDDIIGVLRGPSSFANAFLYVGLGTVALGLVIAFVGTGEKGFKTLELRWIGPSLIGMPFPRFLHSLRVQPLKQLLIFQELASSVVYCEYCFVYVRRAVYRLIEGK